MTEKKRTERRKNIFNNERALVMGIGLHGGGVATTAWLVRHGAKVTATDKRNRIALAPSLRALKQLPVRYVLGKHEMKDFISHEMVVVNPGVPRESEYLAAAKKHNIRIENDASLFFRYIPNPIIAVTGTRGKTTTTLWVAALLTKKYKHVRASGNTPDNAFLKEFERLSGKSDPVVAEMSSWQLELLPVSLRAPHIAVITNLYPDHLNRYKGMKEYANAKANIFLDQHPDDFLILNHENEWTPYYLKKKPKGIALYFSTRALPKTKNGVFISNGVMYFQFEGVKQRLVNVRHFTKAHGEHNLENLLAAMLAVKLFDPSVNISERDILHLPSPRMREEVIVNSKKLIVVNDSCATSPDGTIAALKRFSKLGNIVLIAGGTDKSLVFDSLAKEIKKYIAPPNLVLLSGSATEKIINELTKLRMTANVHDTLSACVSEAFALASTQKGKTVMLFSPSAASFEKFLHEFDRGEQFNKLIQKLRKK